MLLRPAGHEHTRAIARHGSRTFTAVEDLLPLHDQLLSIDRIATEPSVVVALPAQLRFQPPPIERSRPRPWMTTARPTT
ncbi:hypothetical protein [Streptomyces sp. NBC_01435]|uniref:hypothetical protein n=1 Tax=Streptomyces sp. NBC_01435 TaxID=2903865 RepID=UPI002E3494BF|nr:hypothetical protein [Streptomyces sp. NBC_01435]